eukprot:SAG22_NODE_5657_length_976_cov_1.915621_2_plen_208_part_00
MRAAFAGGQDKAPVPPPPCRRIENLAGHLLPPVSSSAAAREPSAEKDLKLLTDAQLKDFIVDGHLVLKVDELPDAWHEQLYDKCRDAIDVNKTSERRSVWADVAPDEIKTICSGRTMVGALTSILGPDYMMHQHRALHVNGPTDQGFHKDGNHVPVRDHYPRWLMGMYFPTETTIDMGPTAVRASQPGQDRTGQESFHNHLMSPSVD